jgi:hypothetical protein
MVLLERRLKEVTPTLVMMLVAEAEATGAEAEEPIMVLVAEALVTLEALIVTQADTRLVEIQVWVTSR